MIRRKDFTLLLLTLGIAYVFACVAYRRILYLQSDLLTVVFKDTFNVNCNVVVHLLQWFGLVYELLHVMSYIFEKDPKIVIPLGPRHVRVILD